MKEALTAFQDGDNVYLQGKFIEFDTPDNTGRVITKQNFVNQFDYLNDKIDNGYLFGEFGQPITFEVSMENVSHSIEALYIEENKVMGRIRVLDTKKGHELLGVLNSGKSVYMGYRSTSQHITNDITFEKIYAFDIISEDDF